MDDNINNWTKGAVELKKQAYDEAIKTIAEEHGLTSEKLKQMFEEKKSSRRIN